jgi:ABC-type polysaccharide/polyol phosphate transport system ATPase subunit
MKRDDVVISIDNVSKLYRLYQNLNDRLKEALHPFKKKYHHDFYALEGVSFDIYKGETVGIIGKNGSGKSTLLKIIVGIIPPSSGAVNVIGDIAALLELGAGFNPEYSGLENIYLQGTIMGFSRKQMDEKIPSILSFADIGDFIHQPVNNYSSGMFARLAFAIAINVEPQILIVDEALSVGDIFFQNKCFRKMDEIKKNGTTILFVSHDLFSVKQFCNRAVWLDQGSIKAIGEVEVVTNAFQNSIFEDINNRVFKQRVNQTEGKDYFQLEEQRYTITRHHSKYEHGGNGKAKIVSFEILDETAKPVNTLKAGQRYQIVLFSEFFETVEDVIFGAALENKNGFAVISWNTFISGYSFVKADEDHIYKSTFAFELPKIQKGEYIFAPAIAQGTQEDHMILDWFHNAMTVYIENDSYNLSIIEIPSEVQTVSIDKKSVLIQE